MAAARKTMEEAPSSRLYDISFGDTIFQHLSTGMYTVADAVWEIVRNALLSAMPSRVDAWEPERTYVECSISSDHPMGVKGKPTLIVRDKGTGLIPEKKERYFRVAADKIKPMNAGASMMGLGRLAGLRLGEVCHVFHRCEEDGPVEWIEVSFARLATRQLEGRMISPKDPCLGEYRGIRGSFLIVVIPAVKGIKTAEELIEILKWRLPRRASQAVKVFINGKLLRAPALASKSISHGDVEVYADVAAPKDKQHGLWLVDDRTGLRVVNLTKMAGVVPYPLYRYDLWGDVFLRGISLLTHQDTNRGGLKDEFLDSAEWTRCRHLLALHAAPFLQELVPDHDSAESPGGREVQELFDDLASVWGGPQGPGGGGGGGGGGGRGGKTPPGGSPDDQSDRGKGRVLKIEDRTFIFREGTLQPYEAVQVTGNLILVNVHNYHAAPANKAYRREHYLMGIFTAIAAESHLSATYAAIEANRLRHVFEDGLRAKK